MKILRAGYWMLLLLLLNACATAPLQQPRIGELKDMAAPPPAAGPASIDATAVRDRYRDFLSNGNDSPAYREALRRLADVELEAAERARDTAETATAGRAEAGAAIDLYQEYLARYADDPNIERVHYQLAKAYDLNGETEDSLAVLARLLQRYPDSVYAEEAWFRSGEMHFSLHQNAQAALAYGVVLERFPASPLYERALYMHGWSLYREGRYHASLQTFFALLDRKSVGDDLSTAVLSRADRELVDDSLRVICFALSSLEGHDAVDAFLAGQTGRPYDPLIQRRLGEFYLEKGRFNDAATAFLGLARRHPDHALAPEFQQYAIDAYRAGGFTDSYLEAKSRFVALYGVERHYWNTHDDANHARVRPYLDTHIRDLATHYHALARRSQSAADFDMAVRWYEEYLKTFPSGTAAAKMNFHLAECLHDAQRYAAAIAAYEKTAYEYAPHNDGAEAGYAALAIYWQRLPGVAENERDAWRRKAIDSSWRFSERFTADRRVDSVLAKTTEELYALQDYPGAIASAQRLLGRPASDNGDARKNAWVLLGHARFDSGDYANAEQAYRAAVDLLAAKDPGRTAITENLTASVYKQGEQQRDAGDLTAAATTFLRAAQTMPASAIAVTAQYDAAATFIELRDWEAALPVLEDIRQRTPGDKHLKIGISEKLALVYQQIGQKQRAAVEMETLAASDSDPDRRREFLWGAATVYQSLDADKDAIRLYERYVAEFAEPIAAAIEARQQLSTLYARRGKSEKSLYWLDEIVKADVAAGAARTERTRRLAGEATLRLVEPQWRAYQKTRLRLPLEKSLPAKKRLMENVIATYRRALEYQIADVTTAATYGLGNLYDDFAKAIMASDRPRGLSPAELEQYDVLLEEQAMLFEEQAIQLHETNLRRVGDGLYDRWIERSVQALAALHPVRYAKVEQSEASYDVIE